MKNIFYMSIPKPSYFCNVSLKSNLEGDFTEILTKLNELLPQLSEFIGQFNHVVLSNNINVTTDSMGNMSIDVPSSMPDVQADTLSKRVGIIDRLITTRGQEIDGLLQRGLEIEKKIQNPEFKSEILEKVKEFKRLNGSYNH